MAPAMALDHIVGRLRLAGNGGERHLHGVTTRDQ